MKSLLTSTTNEFSLIKEFAHQGVLNKVRVVWSFKYMAFVWKFTISTTVK